MSSGIKRSKVRPQRRGSTWLMPIRYPTSNATEEPRPRPGGLSSRGVSGWSEALLFHDLLSQEDYLAVEEQEPGQLVPTYQA